MKDAHRVRELELTFDADLTSYGPDFAQLRCLRNLFLRCTGGPGFVGEPSFRLPPEIGQLTQLRELLLFNVGIREVPPWLTNLSQLRYLMLCGTDITELPADLGRLRRLELLRVENGLLPLRSLPESLRELTKLRRLSFRAGRLEHLPVQVLPPNLTHLELSWSAQFSGVDFGALHRRFPRLQVRISGGR